MSKYFLVCIFTLLAFSVSAAKGGDGGNGGDGGFMGQSGADGGNGSDGGSADQSSGRAGCPGGTDPDNNGNFYLPGTKELCNPGPQDSEKSSRAL